MDFVILIIKKWNYLRFSEMLMAEIWMDIF